MKPKILTLLFSYNHRAVVILLFLTACGYRAVGSDEAVALSIPLIWEDEDGRLREQLAERIAASGRFEYASGDSRFQLIVKIERDLFDNIGYVWDQQPITGRRINRLYPSEGERTITARVHIFDTERQITVVEPFAITVQSEYDFVNPTSLKNVQFTDPQGMKRSVLQFSLGQLDSEEGAKYECNIPIFALLAQEITRALTRIPLNDL